MQHRTITLKEAIILNNNTDYSSLTLAQAIAKLRLIDDEMMRTALQDQKELVQFILRIIMDVPDLLVTHMETQKDLNKPGGGRSLVLDVWAVDSDGTQYDIEIQRASSGASPKRARYHSSTLDTAALRANDDFNSLPRTCVIFITERDCIGDGELLHRYGMCDLKTGKPLDTEQRIIYLNTAFDGKVRKGDENLAALAHDFKCADPDDMILKPVADRMRFLKETEKGRTQMSSIVELYAQQAVNKERKKTEERDLKHAQNIYATGKFTASEIADLLELDADEVRKACGLQQIS